MNKMLLVLSFIIISCSSVKLEKIEGVDRVPLKQSSYEAPAHFITPDLDIDMKSRSIASHAKVDQNVTMKELYFGMLWRQFHSIADKEDAINSCPQFHNTLLNHQFFQTKDYVKFDKKISNIVSENEHYALYPVMALPYKGVDVYSHLKNDNFQDEEAIYNEALDEYNKRNKQELDMLCQYGKSDDFYKFQNMITYFSDEGSLSKKKSLEGLLKISVFSNMYILNHSRIHNSYSNHFLHKANIHWFADFLKKSDYRRKSIERSVSSLGIMDSSKSE